MQHQFEQRKSFPANQLPNKDAYYETAPKLKFEFYFKLFGLISINLDLNRKFGPVKQDRTPVRFRRLYGQVICSVLWFFTLRCFILMFISDRQIQVILGDLTGYWNSYRIYFLMPTFFLSLQTALTSTTFLSKERQLTWLIPFLSITQHQQEVANNPHIILKHTRRINFFIFFNLFLILAVSASMGYLIFSTAYFNMDENMFRLWIPWGVVQVIVYFYMTGITFFSIGYFSLVCKVVEKRFNEVSNEIEALAEADPGPPGSKNDDLTRLYYAHNELCELVEESNGFWASYLFNTYMTYIPCIFSWGTFFYTFIALATISISASDVSAEAHAPYTALHTLSLLQLPIDLEVNMSTFLHRVRGPTIGYSCLDLFVITNSSVSNTLAAVASYFLIVADFSRSTVTQGIPTIPPPPNCTIAAARGAFLTGAELTSTAGF